MANPFDLPPIPTDPGEIHMGKLPLDPSERPLSTISALEWVRWKWLEVTQQDDRARLFVIGRLRTPEEAAREQANVNAIGWDEYRMP